MKRGGIGKSEGRDGKRSAFFTPLMRFRAKRENSLSLISIFSLLLTLTSFVPCAAASTEETISSANRSVKYDCER